MAVSKTKKTTTSKASTKKVCEECKVSKALSQYYVVENKFYGKTHLGLCKECINRFVKEKGSPYIYQLFKQLDIPYVHYMWEQKSDTDTPLGYYLKIYNASFAPFDKIKGWDNSIFPKDESDKDVSRVTESMIDFFGEGYTEQEYLLMQKKYNFLKNNYPESTAFHVEALKTYVRYRVKEELATARGDVGDASKWSGMAKDAATQAKINPSQMSKSDLQGGLNSFGELIKAVEENADIIKVMPRFKYLPQDAPDFIIWTYINYVRDLKGLPQASYADIYSFYDKKKLEYIEQYGDPFDMFKDDIDIKNRSAIEKFVVDYIDKVKKEKTEEQEDDVFGGD